LEQTEDEIKDSLLIHRTWLEFRATNEGILLRNGERMWEEWVCIISEQKSGPEDWKRMSFREEILMGKGNGRCNLI